MRPFRDLPIQRKLTLTFFLTASAALLLAGGALFTYELFRFKQTLIESLEANAAIVADTGTAAIAFDDPTAVNEAMSHLKIRPEVACAYVLDGSGKVIASYQHPLDGVDLNLPARPYKEHRIEKGAVVVFSPIKSKDGQTVGFVAIRASLGELRERMLTYLGILTLVSTVSLLATWFLTGKLQRFISEPLLKLAQVTRAVRETQNFSLRAQAASHDEVGELVESFNQMLAQIQIRDEAVSTSEERFKQLANSIREVFWLTGVKKDRMIYISPGYEPIWGRSCASLYESPMSWAEAIHVDDRARVLAAASKQQAVGEYDEMYRIVRPDGSMRWIRDRAFPVRNDKGEVFRIAGIAEDVTERKQAEEERDRFFNLSLDLLCIASLDGHIKRINPASLRILGYAPEEVIGKPWIEFIHPDDRPQTLQRFGMLLSGEDLVGFEVRCICKDGSWRTISWSCPSPAPATHELFAVGRDVTVQHLAEQQLLESEQRFRTLTEFAPIGIFHSAPDGKCRFVNRAWCNITGLPPEAALGDGWTRALHPGDASRVLTSWEQTITDGKDSSIEYRMTDATGNVHWVHGKAVCLRNSAGESTGYLGTVLDITDRKQFEAEREKFVSLIENSQDFIAMASLSEEVFFVNKAGLKLVGLNSISDLRGRHIHDFLTETSRQISHDQEVPAMKAGGHWEGEYQLRHFQTGHGIDVQVSSFAIKDPATNEIVGFATVQRDITDRKRMEKEILEISDRERNRLGQDVHDSICQMLVSAGFTANMLMRKLEDKSLPEVADAEKVAQLIDETTEQAYQLSRGAFLAALDAEGLAPMLQDLAANVRRRSQVACSFEYPTPVSIDNDAVANHVFRIAQEAVNNAVKHGKPRHIVIKLIENGQRIELIVMNDGEPFPLDRPTSKGLGFFSMQYRASMIRGTLQHRQGDQGETIIYCAFPNSTA